MKLVEVMHVSPRKVERPRKIAKNGSKATKQVLCKGEISINRAYDTTVAECASKEQSDEIVSELSREEQFKLAQRFLAAKRFYGSHGNGVALFARSPAKRPIPPRRRRFPRGPDTSGS